MGLGLEGICFLDSMSRVLFPCADYRDLSEILVGGVGFAGIGYCFLGGSTILDSSLGGASSPPLLLLGAGAMPENNRSSISF